MVLNSIYDENGNYLTNKSKGFHARSCGCSCCSTDLHSEQDVKKEAIESLKVVLTASKFFKWDVQKLINRAKKKGERTK